MPVAYLQSSFRVPSAATIRFTRDDSGATVDWSLTAGTVYKSADHLAAQWKSTIQGSGSFGLDFAVDVTIRIAASYQIVKITTGGPAFSVDWSHAGDGSAVRDFLGESGNISGGADGATFSGAVPAAYVARYGATRVSRSATSRDRGQFLALDGTSSWSQHHASPDDHDTVRVEVELWAGDTAATNARSPLLQLEQFVDALFDEAGAGEPFALYLSPHDAEHGVSAYQALGGDHAVADTDRWDLRFAGSALRLVPARVSGSQPDRLFRITFSADVDGAAW